MEPVADFARLVCDRLNELQGSLARNNLRVFRSMLNASLELLGEPTGSMNSAANHYLERCYLSQGVAILLPSSLD